jgi:hypothetical protein
MSGAGEALTILPMQLQVGDHSPMRRAREPYDTFAGVERAFKQERR